MVQYEPSNIIPFKRNQPIFVAGQKRCLQQNFCIYQDTLLPHSHVYTRLLGGIDLRELGETTLVQLLRGLGVLGLKLLAMAAPWRICKISCRV